MTASSGCGISGRSFNSSSSGNWSPQLRSRRMVFFQSMVPPSLRQREQVESSLAVVVVHVGGADALLHQLEVRAPRPRRMLAWPVSKHVVEAARGSAPRTCSRRSALERSLGIFSSRISTPRCAGEEVELFERARRPRRTCACRTLRRPRRCAGSGTGTGMVSAISSARLISSTMCRRARLHRFGDGDDGVRPGAAPDLVVVHGRVQRVQLQIGIAEPVAQFGDLRLIAIIQVLARAEDLHRGDPGLLDFAEQRRWSAGG